MKKKSLAIVIALIMAMVLGTSAMATSSIQVSGIIKDATAWDAEDTEWGLSIRELNSGEKVHAKELDDADTLDDILGGKYHKGLKVMGTAAISIVGNANAVVWPLTMELEIKGVKEDSEIYMLQYVDGKWKVVPIEVGDGFITAEVDSLSIFAFVAAEDYGKSPQTGQPMTTAVVAMIMAAAAVIVVVSKRGFAR